MCVGEFPDHRQYGLAQSEHDEGGQEPPPHRETIAPLDRGEVTHYIAHTDDERDPEHEAPARELEGERDTTEGQRERDIDRAAQQK